MKEMKAFADWFFDTAAGHWVLRDMTTLQFLMICFFTLLILGALFKVTVNAFRVINWRLIGARTQNFVFRSFAPATWK